MLSKLPVSARRAVSSPVVAVPVDAALACAVTCGDGLAAADASTGVSGVAFADGTNHRAHSRPPAAAAVSNGRRADDTEYRSPCGAGELAVWADVSESRGSQESHGRGRPYAPGMSTRETSRFVRVRVDLVLEVDDEQAVTGAALQALAGDADLSDAERAHAEQAVTDDTAEALAYLVDPFDLVGEVPGVELQQASWSSEQIDYDPDSPEWDLDEDDGDENDPEDDEMKVG
ncbi:hypothetical protein CJI59_12280 [Streptomyces sp. Alain-F2R5]|nr:hypothetical protein CJI59_12280 [Streptomyces sp. Alain-F2R5]